MMPSGASARERFFDALGHRRLRRGEPDEPGALVTDRRRGDVHDACERRLAQQRERGARGADHGEHAEVELVEPRGVGEVVEPADVRGADGVHQRVALAPALVEERERGFDLAGVEQVALEPDGVLGARGEELLLRFAEVARRAGEHRDARALGGEQLGGGASHAAGAAGDDRGPSPQSEVHQTRVPRRAGGRGASAVSGSPVARVDQLVPAQRRAGREHVVAEQRAGRGAVDEAAGAVAQRRVELRREQLAVEVVLVVDGRGREVDLRRPVGRVAAVGPVQQLVLLDEVPPERVEVGVGIGVEAALEVRHHQHPAGEHEERGALRVGERGRDRVDVVVVDRGDARATTPGRAAGGP